VAYNLSDVVSRAEGLDWQQTSLRVSDNFSSAFVQRLNAGERNSLFSSSWVLSGGFLAWPEGGMTDNAV
jgi:hypothetical protein